MLIFLYGKDTFRSREQLHKMVSKFKTDRDPSGYNVSYVDALTEKPGVVIAELFNMPFLAEKRLVVIEHGLESKHLEVHAKLEEIIEDDTKLPASTICVLYERTDSYKTKVQKELLKKLAKTKYAQHFEVLEGLELQRWILEYAKDCGLALEKNAADYIALHSKGDAWFIHSLIEQLAAFAAGKPATVEMARLFLAETADDSIFNLVDAIVLKKPEKAYAMIREQYDNGQDAFYIFAMLVRQFRIMLEIKDALARAPATPPEILAKEMAIHPFVVKKTTPLLRAYTIGQLRALYEDLLSIDIKTKTGKGSMPVLIDMLVGKICVR